MNLHDPLEFRLYGNVQNQQGETFLMLAAHMGRDDVVTTLLEQKDIDVNLQDWGGTTALILAVRFGHINIVEQLLAHPNINVNIFPSGEDDEKWTALMFSVQSDVINRLAIVGQLLAHPNINVNIQDDDGMTALMIVSIVPVVWQSTGQAGQLVWEEEEEGKERAAIVCQLLEHKEIDVNVKNRRGDTALMLASKAGHENIVNQLLEHKEIDVNAQNNKGTTALMDMVKVCNSWKYPNAVLIVDRLLRAPGIDVTCKNNRGGTALDMARIYRSDMSCPNLISRLKCIKPGRCGIRVFHPLKPNWKTIHKEYPED